MSRSEAPRVSVEGTESFTAKRGTESPAIGESLIEEVCERENCKQALARVKANKGSPGLDRKTVQQLPEYLKQHWLAIRDGGVRKLGIPSVLDRFIQQAVMQRQWDRTFSEHSFS